MSGLVETGLVSVEQHGSFGFIISEGQHRALSVQTHPDKWSLTADSVFEGVLVVTTGRIYPQLCMHGVEDQVVF